ncbi:MAG: DNA-formamidopyrimidine glycosylase family protein [Myxococcota bacterium]
MPELPDVTLYVERLSAKVVDRPLEAARVASPFVLRTVQPPLSAVEGKRVTEVRRLGKRIVLRFESDLFLVIHLMVAGRLRWKKKGVAVPKKNGLAAFDFPDGSVLFTEASTKKRASIHVVEGEAGLADHDRGGLEVFGATPKAFGEALRRSNHTLKRALTDPRILSGIGNAYSDEILFSARMSPFKLTQKLTDEEVSHLLEHTRTVLERFTETMRAEIGEGFPDKVTAFRDDMFVHGRYREPCRVCGTKIQRVAYAENEMNYCPTCQNAGRLLADPSLSRLMKKDWPKTVEELEQLRKG